MRNISVIVLLISLASCLGPKKIDKWVGQHYEGTVPVIAKTSNEFVSVANALSFTDSRLSSTEKKTSNLVPLLFYWSYDYKNTTKLNPAIPAANFTKTVLAYSRKLKQKLNGGKLELTLDQLPNSFAIDDKGHLIWVIVYVIGWDVLTIQPINTEMVVSYKLMDKGTVVKSGQISISSSGDPVTLKMYQSLKKKTMQYLDEYETTITTLSKKLIDKLADEL